MSVENTILIPADPRYVPDSTAVEAAVGILRALVGDGEIDIETWQEWMSRDWSEATGFALQPIAMPCCARSLTLDELDYEGPRGPPASQ